MRKYKFGFSLAFLLLAAGALGACQAGGATSGGTDMSNVTLVPGEPVPDLSKGKKKDPSLAKLTSYKRYNTTENLCKKTCRAESRCVKETFTPIRKYGKYTAGQCQLYGR